MINLHSDKYYKRKQRFMKLALSIVKDGNLDLASKKRKVFLAYVFKDQEWTYIARVGTYTLRKQLAQVLSLAVGISPPIWFLLSSVSSKQSMWSLESLGF